ncbi:unnamed protein product [Nyctereutes procyonoides]|uniref:(raccoon dog) hypothetical protein n=1 Tax=Nyctereutes procyonoides TaxID=34880 RepID=A0A811ZHK9_NYCPR|nr:unnamed protein product [Nyctereutes procyonoides]CAD7688322.1 unnamed protein product [Nyctereutes procyonoides]
MAPGAAVVGGVCPRVQNPLSRAQAPLSGRGRCPGRVPSPTFPSLTWLWSPDMWLHLRCRVPDKWMARVPRTEWPRRRTVLHVGHVRTLQFGSRWGLAVNSDRRQCTVGTRVMLAVSSCPALGGDPFQGTGLIFTHLDLTPVLKMLWPQQTSSHRSSRWGKLNNISDTLRRDSPPRLVYWLFAAMTETVFLAPLLAPSAPVAPEAPNPHSGNHRRPITCNAKLPVMGNRPKDKLACVCHPQCHGDWHWQEHRFSGGNQEWCRDLGEVMWRWLHSEFVYLGQARGGREVGLLATRCLAMLPFPTLTRTWSAASALSRFPAVPGSPPTRLSDDS